MRQAHKLPPREWELGLFVVCIFLIIGLVVLW
jgi:hypothetical protein